MAYTLLQQDALEEKVVGYALSLIGAPFRPHTKLHTSRLKQSKLGLVGESYVEHGHLAVGQENGFDCSGFVQHVFAESIGVDLPRHTIEMFCSVESGYIGESALSEVRLDEIRKADLLFLRRYNPMIPSHVAIYSGNGEVVHSSRRTNGVAATKLEEMLPRLLAVKRVVYAR